MAVATMLRRAVSRSLGQRCRYAGGGVAAFVAASAGAASARASAVSQAEAAPRSSTEAPEAAAPRSTAELLTRLWGDSSRWETVRHDRDGYFLELPNAETDLINAAGGVAAAERQHPGDGDLEPELYGEISYDGCEQLLGRLVPLLRLRRSSWTFLDLGSGTGKMVAQVAMDNPGVALAVGVELSATRHRAGQAALDEAVRRGWMRQSMRARIALRHGDLTQAADLAAADVVFIANYAFSDAFTEQIARQQLSAARAPSLQYVPANHRTLSRAS